ncbi:MAG: hypothetical protein ABIR03_14220 [Ginsengibacter sp.]
MCNCGNKRNELNAFSLPMRGTFAINTNREKMVPDVNFEYTGKSALSVTGNITGKRYRFAHPGDERLIHYSDAPGMMTVPVLKKVNG